MLIKLPVYIETVSSKETADVYEQDGTFLCMCRDADTAEAIARALNSALHQDAKPTEWPQPGECEFSPSSSAPSSSNAKNSK